MGAKVKAEIQLIDPPISLDRGAGISLDGQTTELKTFDRDILKHERTSQTLFPKSEFSSESAISQRG
jgi:hypothetical protein